MERKTLYARYHAKYESELSRAIEVNASLYAASIAVEFVTALEFLRLPYHEKLRLAGLKIKLKKIVSCSELRHHPVAEPIELPKIDKDYLTEYRRDDVYLMSEKNEAYPVYPFEYDIVW